MFETVPEYRPFGGTGRRDRAFQILLHCTIIPLATCLLPVFLVIAWIQHLYTSTRKVILRGLIEVAEASGAETDIRGSLDLQTQQVMRYSIRSEHSTLIRETLSPDLLIAIITNAVAGIALRRYLIRRS